MRGNEQCNAGSVSKPRLLRELDAVSDAELLLGEAIDKLHGRLGPVICDRPTVAVPGNTGGEDREDASPLVLRLQELRHRLELRDKQLHHLLNALEV